MTSSAWRKSSRSTQGTSETCVEVARLRGAIGIRDGKASAAGHLSASADRFGQVLARVKRGELDL